MDSVHVNVITEKLDLNGMRISIVHHVPVHCPRAGPRLSHRLVLSSCLPLGCPLSWKQDRPLCSITTLVQIITHE